MENNKNSRKKKSKTNIKPKKKLSVIRDIPIVGIGASAGGLEALELFFKNMPKDSGMAFVVIQHLDPNYVGIMPELLQRVTQMKVYLTKDRLIVKPNCVYMIPPNKSMTLLNGALHLSDPVGSRGLHLPIDVFFRSMANDRMEKSIGIILSGMGSDGSLGLKAIKEKNGIVLVQDPASAKFDGMPVSAIETVIIDIVAPVEELPSKMISLLKFKPDVKEYPKLIFDENSQIEKIIIILREFSGHDFSLYKKTTLYRRIERRKGIHQINKIQDYVRFLQENKNETEILFKELLIGVTRFFRDFDVWNELKENILPGIIDLLPEGYQLRSWIPGCSTGEEAYSLAIIFKEVIEKSKNSKNITLQIFATDLDHDAIDIARRGIFSTNIVTDVSAERIRKFFNIEGEYYKLNTSIREMVVFAPQNVIKDPPFTKIDILSCRNMLIYMEPDLQKKLIALFNYSLNYKGIMILGSAETLENKSKGFQELNGKLKIYIQSSELPATDYFDFPNNFFQNKIEKKRKQIIPRIVENIQVLTDKIILQEFAPPSVLVNSLGDILYVTGKTEKYLEIVAGKANWNIHVMAKEGLRNELPRAFSVAMQNFKPVILRNIKIGKNGEDYFVDVTFQRIEKPDIIRDMILIVFSDVSYLSKNDKDNKKVTKYSSARKQKKIELELQHSYDELQRTREEMQTSQEELKSINEELQSTNEELQSTNEELTTSKEEMQSLNEELQTVNIELQSKVNDYIRANDDMKNLLNSTEIATLFLDKELNIRRFTDQVTKIFKLRKSDIGRPFTDLVSDLKYPEIEKDALQVLKSLVSVEMATATNDNRWFNVRIMPYRTLDDHIDGLVITFTDISEEKKLEAELKNTKDELFIIKAKIN